MRLTLIALSAVLAGGGAFGQGYPAKAVRIITAEIGGGNDYTARLIAQGLAVSLGQSVVVENRGGSVIVAAEFVAKSPPDGHTLLLYGSNIWIQPFMRDNVPYDVFRDFAPVTLAASSPSILVVHPALPVKSARDLIALAKARPGELNYAAAPGGLIHIAAELFKAQAGINMVHVAYKGGAPSLNAMISGEVQLMFPTAGTVAAHLKSGRLRALGVTSAKPSVLFPTLPTVAATGLPGYEAISRFAVFAPARTPEAIVSRLNQEMARILGKADVIEKFHVAGIEPVGSTPGQLTAAMKSEMAVVGKVIRNAGIRVE
jgi:tripartite-type tricarboxylate transporter receptor subunit TctC